MNPDFSYDIITLKQQLSTLVGEALKSREGDSNTRPLELQSTALPTELSRVLMK